MKITTGNYEVFDSVTVISFEENPVTFHLADDLQIRLAFRDEIEKKDEHRLNSIQYPIMNLK